MKRHASTSPSPPSAGGTGRKASSLCAFGWAAVFLVGEVVLPWSATGEDGPDPLAFIGEWSGHLAESALVEVSQAEVLRTSLHRLLESLGETSLETATAPRDYADALKRFGQAIDVIASRPGQRRTRFELAEEALSLYLSTLDPYSRYRDATEMKAYADAVAPGSAGIGMELMEQGDQFLGFPLPDSSAERAGIPQGAKLLTVDGRSVDGLALYEIARLIRGVPGTKVSLRFDQSFGRSQVCEALREAHTLPSVLIQEESGGGLVLKPHRMDSKSLAEIRAVASSGRWFPSLTLDLRGCQGGELDPAAEIAELFLPEGAPIGSAKGRATQREYVSDGPQLFKPLRLTILHNKGTASAAEFLLGALMDNRDRLRVETSGERTYGKAMAQVALRLSNGGVLHLTTSRLYLPSGKNWDGEGLDGSSFPGF